MLLLWLNGFGCAMCCGKDAVEAHCSNEKVIAEQALIVANSATESAPACQNAAAEKAQSNCCKKSSGKPTLTTESKSETPPPQISKQRDVAFCALLPKQLPALTVAPQSSVSLDAEASTINPLFAVIVPLSAQPFIRPALPQNRGGTYLRCCVFLI